MDGWQMTRLTKLIDRLPIPELPANISEKERQKILLVLASAKQQIRPFEDNFEAHWLLTSFPSFIWETTNRGREELVGRTWQNTIRLDWRVSLPNGSSLTDTRNDCLLTLAKKTAFLMRSNVIVGSSAPRTWLNHIYELLRIIRWTVLHEDKFQPEKYGLGLLDQPAIEWLLCEIAKGGWSHALQIPQRILSALYQGANGVACPQSLIDNPYKIPKKEINALQEWIEQQNGYKYATNGAHFGKRYINRGFIGRLISDSPWSLLATNILRFLRQLEPDFKSESLLIRTNQPTEFPAQKTGSISDTRDITGSEDSVEGTTKILVTLLDAHLHIPNLLPDPANISLHRATNVANNFTKVTSHTMFIPLDIGLKYLNTAMMFVQIYGDAIVDFYLSIFAEANSGADNFRLNQSVSRCNWRIESGESIAARLNITEWRCVQANPDYYRLRSNPSLDDAMRILIGSCIVCMALLKPSRQEELTHLKRDCLREYAGGYWLNFKLGKSNCGDAWRDEDRPIPVITAKAISLLQRLGDGLSKLIIEDRKVADNLFYIPKFEGIGALKVDATLINRHLNIFCDFVGLPPDPEGRRWYIRVHEMRKWFLLMLFWSGRFDVLDAARWVAGHTDAKNIYTYIEKAFPGEELPQIEAEYSIDRIYRRDQERGRSNGYVTNPDSVDALYEVVLRHFHVQTLSLIPESEWSEYVFSLRKNEKFRLEPHSVFSESGIDVIGMDVSFVLREVD